jgi:hypothetical protein
MIGNLAMNLFMPGGKEDIFGLQDDESSDRQNYAGNTDSDHRPSQCDLPSDVIWHPADRTRSGINHMTSKSSPAAWRRRYPGADNNLPAVESCDRNRFLPLECKSAPKWVPTHAVRATTEPGQGAAIDNEIVVTYRHAIEPAFKHLPGARGIARLCGQR